jgi:cold-inducible RNA-binding protein
MSMKLYVGNLGYQISKDGLEQLFAQAGTIESARVGATIAGNPRGFGFVAMSSREEGAGPSRNLMEEKSMAAGL